MVKSRVTTLPKRGRRSLSEILGPVLDRRAAEAVRSETKDPASAKATAATNRPYKGPGVKLWGFVRRHQDVQEKAAGSELLPQDIAIWFDRKRSRFEIVAERKVIDDLAPMEFVQFVRALRYSTTQILFKFENRSDGTDGRPVCVWSRPTRPSQPDAR
jgi:hypothetical protein